ncbi:oligopeptide transport system permease protein [Caldanaerobius fijiensis DSM 17918]|uniref:Oligopeptide transport system permease protein n=1 Tax=Caldanaerobius fijiensis DSM 17918 TaxID=1121256 RepID=A0A1M5CHJ4_9THEO|nr:ABC transporter permease [Caldanaerobius fijiensis]SHF54141.1 oligopeptide transport system permease protein [Caldanaerobius fijiensis DSM 17918]
MDIEQSKFEHIGYDLKSSERIVRPSVSFWQDAFRRLRQNKMATISLFILAIIIMMAIIGPYLRPFSYDEQDYTAIFQPPNAVHWFGTDNLGRDLFVRSWMGARVSLRIGFIAAVLNMIVGVIYGGISGYFGGLTDEIMMRIVDVLYSIPTLIIVILLMIIMQPGEFTIILAMALTGWVDMARLVRGQVLQLKEQEYVLAARTLGAGPWRIITKHLIPNALGPIIVRLTLNIPSAIFTEAFLSYIGLGIRLPKASWGSLATDGTTYLQNAPWLLIFPAVLISLTMLTFNILGDGIRDALDPRMRK